MTQPNSAGRPCCYEDFKSFLLPSHTFLCHKSTGEQFKTYAHCASVMLCWLVLFSQLPYTVTMKCKTQQHFRNGFPLALILGRSWLRKVNQICADLFFLALCWLCQAAAENCMVTSHCCQLHYHYYFICPCLLSAPHMTHMWVWRGRRDKYEVAKWFSFWSEINFMDNTGNLFSVSSSWSWVFCRNIIFY